MNGRMNTAPIRLTIVVASSDVAVAASKVTNTTNAFLNTLSLPAPRNCVQKNGAKRRWRRRSNWFGVVHDVGPVSRRDTEHGPERVTHRAGIGPVPDFLAYLLALEHSGSAQHLEMVRDGGTRQRRRGDDLPDVESLARLEHEHDALPVRVAQRDEDPGRLAPGSRNRAGIAGSHAAWAGSGIVGRI